MHRSLYTALHTARYALVHQAASRLHRSGQQNKVTLSWLIACGPSRRGRLADLADEECEDVENVMDAKHVPLEDARTFERLAQRALTRV